MRNLILVRRLLWGTRANNGTTVLSVSRKIATNVKIS